MATTTTRKKTSKTRAKAAPPLKKPSRSSKTRASTSTTGNTKESRSSGRLDARKGEALLRSFLNSTSIEEEYARGGLPPAKKDGRTNWHKGRTLTPEERQKLLSFDIEGPDGTIVRRGVGRPSKPQGEKQKPVPFNLSDRLLEGFRERAKAQGFTNWQEWLRTIGAKEAGLLQESTK